MKRIMENQNETFTHKPQDDSLALDVVERVEPVHAPQATATKDFAATAQEYGQKFTAATKQAQEFLTERANMVSDKIKELQEKDLTEVAEQAKDYARQKPMQAIAISAAAGFILGMILRSGRR